jgi:peptidoglycan/xylan/chitin deacetylase (PgdA/CDA1 family)
VTFDDGYADNHDVALPILQRVGIPATFFIASGHLDGGRMWNDTVIESIRRARGAQLDLSDSGLGAHAIGTLQERRAAMRTLLRAIKYRPPSERAEIVASVAATVGAALPGNLMMSRGQVRGLHRAGMEIGAHTRTHPILARLTTPEAEREMADGKAELEGIIGGPVRLFAYPNGKPIEDYTAEHVAIARKVGFRAAVTTSWGAGRRTSDLFQLPRFTPWDRTPMKFAVRLLLNARQPGVELR